MSREEVYQKLNEVLRKTFEEDCTVDDESISSDIDGWNSLTHASMIINLEEAFGIKFSMGEIATMNSNSVGTMVDIIMKKLS